MRVRFPLSAYGSRATYPLYTSVTSIAWLSLNASACWGTKQDWRGVQDRQNIVLQHKVQECIAAGRMLEAIAAVEEAAPGTLESHPRVKFQLQCQQFVEMVCSCWLLLIVHSLDDTYESAVEGR